MRSRATEPAAFQNEPATKPAQLPELPPVGPLYHQVWFADPGAPFGRVGSNGLLLEYE